MIPSSLQATTSNQNAPVASPGPRTGRVGSIVFISTVPQTLWYFARPHWRGLGGKGYKITAISSPGKFLDRCLEEGADSTFAIELQRAITPLSDLLGVLRLTRFLRRIRPCLLHTYTPKAGLIGMLAAAAA